MTAAPFAALLSSLLFAAPVPPPAAPDDARVAAFFDRPEHTLRSTFKAELVARDLGALRSWARRLAQETPEDTQAALSPRAGMTLDDALAASREARELISAGNVPAPLGEQARRMGEALAGSGTALQKDAGASFDGAGPKRGHKEFYVSWGYNGETYAPTDIRFRQPALGNDFTLHGVRGRDSKGWYENGRIDVLNHAVSVPQYSVRIGTFFNRYLGAEIAYDHPKYIVNQDQTVQVTGTMDGRPVNGPVTLTEDVLKYKLNNGANFLLFNVVGRLPLIGDPQKSWSVAGLARAGAGFLLPHTENTVLGRPNDPGFQFGGKAVGASIGARFRLPLGIYLDYEEKLMRGSYSNVHIAQGRADHGLKVHERVLSLGVSFRIGKK